MKTRFNTYDIICGVTELQQLIGLRVNQIYDIDNKTYLIKFQHPDKKYVLLLESGMRFHTTVFEWPKNVAPSGFSMKLRKHLKNKRLESLKQLGSDRIINLQFGSNEAAYHIILELYDRGNIILTDHELTILNILRPHTEGEEVRFAVREQYPINRAKEPYVFEEDKIKKILQNANPGDNLRKILTPILDCGPSVIDHVLQKYDLTSCVIQGVNQSTNNDDAKEIESNTQKKGGKQGKSNRKDKKRDNINSRFFDFDKDFQLLINAIKDADNMVLNAKQNISKGFLIQKKEVKPSDTGDKEEYFYHNIEYHPFLFLQHSNQSHKEFETFMMAVDEFYSTLEGQKIDVKAMQQEREALKKLSNVKKDHAKRLEELNKTQETDKQRAELITRNQTLVDNAILAVRSAIANQMSWPDIHELVKAAQANNDPVAKAIKQLKLEINHITLTLHDPYVSDDDDDSGNKDSKDENEDRLPSMCVDVDLALSAFANARKYYDQKRSAAKKEQRTIDASQKALKSAEKKTQQALKEVRTISTISKARKVLWFEKFYWFISSENYLVIGGRDSQQNEFIVKRYMKPTDIYVHAEIQGASSVVIKNPTGGEIPPKTLLEAGTMAISYSVAWDAKVVTNAYWVKSDQVSKTAPSGEYLGTGSFMIRGKKNFLPPCHLIMGLSLLFKLEESSIERHKGERKVKIFDDNSDHYTIENEKLEAIQETEIELEDSDKEEEEDDENKSKKSYHHSSDNDNDEDDKEKDQIPTFPDTEIKVEHDTGKVMVQVSIDEEANTATITIKGSEEDHNQKNVQEEDSEQTYIIPAAPTRIKLQQQNSKKKKEQNKKHRQDKGAQIQSQLSQQEKCNDDKNSTQMKRGQRGKLKKMKTKYKDQDEEERQLRMQLLKSAGKMDKVKEDESKNDNECPIKNKSERNEQQKQKIQHQQDQQDIDDVDETTTNFDTDMLDSLTGNPVEEDELLFAIPVVAPFKALQNYKYKVKLTPGTGKRGRAAKTALLMFTKDKSCTLREKDLLKGIKEEQLARNIPGKVKISAPQLQKFRK